MVNFQNSKIYKIFSTVDDSICYVGSTTKKYLSSRIAEHRCCYNRWKANKFNKVSIFELFDKYDVNTFKIELLEKVDCDNLYELYSKERNYVDSLNCINKNLPNRRSRDIYKEYQKLYRLNHVEYFKEYNKMYREKLKLKNSLENSL